MCTNQAANEDRLPQEITLDNITFRIRRDCTSERPAEDAFRRYINNAIQADKPSYL